MKWMKTTLMLAAALSASSASAQNSAGYAWNNTPMGGGGFVTGIFPAKTQSGVVYARTDVGGAYRWDNSASRWVPLMDWITGDDQGLMGIDSMAVDPKNAANVVMLAGTSYSSNGKTAIMRSTNYGANWTVTDVTAQFKTHGNGYGRQSGERLAFDPGSSNILYVGTRYDGLFKSTDSGATWTRLSGINVTTTPNGVGVNLVLPDPTSVVNGVAQRLIVGVSRYSYTGPNLYRSDNAGQTFYAINGAPGNLMPQRGAFDGQGNLYLTYGNGAGPNWINPTEIADNQLSQGAVMKYNVNNGSWTNVSPNGMNAPFSGVSVDAANANRVIVSTINLWWDQWNDSNGKATQGDRIFLSTNGGGSWTDLVATGTKATGGVGWIADSALHWASTVVFDPFNSQTAWVTSGNGIFKSTNVGAAQPTWTFNVNGLEETVVLDAVSVPGGAVISGVGDVDGFLQYNTWGYNQRLKPYMGNTNSVALAGSNASVLARVGNSLQVSLNGGVNWFTSGSINGSSGRVVLSANGGVLLHTPGGSTVTYRSVNNGTSWTAVNNLNMLNAWIVADSVNSNLFYAYDNSNGKIWVSYDGGVNFYNVSTAPTWGNPRMRTVPGIQGDIWLPMYNQGLMRSTNSGSSFSKIGSVTECRGIGFGKAAANGGYPTIFIWGVVNGVRGMFRSTDTGNTWLLISDSAHQYGMDGELVFGDMNTFGVVYSKTAGRGLVAGRPQ
jgi:hypothetical protein